nr:probable protein S-acyltransferase 6 [Tanacetum cinerariifolium]
MKRSIDYVSNIILHANKKPALGSSLTPRERRHARRDRIREEENTPREQRHARRDKVREAENKLRKKDRTINQKHAKKREHKVEVESVKEVQSSRTTGSGVESKFYNKLLNATPSPIQMVDIPLGSQQRDVIGVAETSSDARSLYLTIGLIVVPIILFFYLVSQSIVNFFPDNTGHLSVAFHAVFTFYIVVFIFLVAARDPGIIPRTQPSSDVDDDCS